MNDRKNYYIVIRHRIINGWYLIIEGQRLESSVNNLNHHVYIIPIDHYLVIYNVRLEKSYQVIARKEKVLSYGSVLLVDINSKKVLEHIIINKGRRTHAISELGDYALNI